MGSLGSCRTLALMHKWWGKISLNIQRKRILRKLFWEGVLMIFHSIVSMYDESEDDEMEIRMEKQKFGQYDCSSFILSEREQERI